VSARLVVAADGRRSFVARQIGLLTEHRRFRKFAVRGHWRGMQGMGDEGEMHVGGGGYCGIAPLPDGEANVAFVLESAAVRSAAGGLEAFYRATLSRWPRIAERLQGATLVAPPRAVGPLALVARRVSAAGVLLVGDAAGFYDPFTGEGVTLALRSAELAAAEADRALRLDRTADLRDYDRRRDEATREPPNRLIHGYGVAEAANARACKPGGGLPSPITWRHRGRLLLRAHGLRPAVLCELLLV
jgi:flavin-dependent dehydrogenase